MKKASDAAENGGELDAISDIAEGMRNFPGKGHILNRTRNPDTCEHSGSSDVRKKGESTWEALIKPARDNSDLMISIKGETRGGGGGAEERKAASSRVTKTNS